MIIKAPAFAGAFLFWVYQYKYVKTRTQTGNYT